MTDRNREFRNFRMHFPAFLAALLLALLCLPAGFAHPVFGADERGETCRLTIKAMYEEDSGKAGVAVSKPASGMRIRLWRTADLVEDSDGWTYKPVDAFASVPVSYKDMTASESARAARQLAAAAGNNPDAEGLTGSDGQLSFDSLKPGIYLAVQVQGNGKVRMDPCLWQVPMPEYDSKTGKVSWIYDVEVMPKTDRVVPEKHENHTKHVTHGKTSSTPGNPAQKKEAKTSHAGQAKTGDTAPILPYAIAAGAALGVMILVGKGRKEGKE